MPRATTCLLNGNVIGVKDALDYRENARLRGKPTPDFRCIECHEFVRPHREGGNAAAHFEHLRRNPDCSLSDPERT